MKALLAIGVLLFTAPLALLQSATAAVVTASAPASRAAQSGIHPAVARIVAPGNGSVSYGSGTLVFVNDQYGLVITNWHVINEATGSISVHFPNGFYSLGTVQKYDRDWDLAIIVIRPPDVQPVKLASDAPRPGETLTIAGYGSGQYREVSGRCTQYVAPGTSFPYEMVEVAASARQGDSGGPIFNSRGELAGVLFGEGHGRTSGSYCGRVQWFLSSVAPIAADNRPLLASAALKPVVPPMGLPAEVPPDRFGAAPSMSHRISDRATVRAAATTSADQRSPQSTGSTQAALPQTQHIGWTDIAGETTGEQVKTVLAGIGILALLLHLLRRLGAEPAKA